MTKNKFNLVFFILMLILSQISWANFNDLSPDPPKEDEKQCLKAHKNRQYDLAFTWCENAAEDGSVASQNKLADIYFFGQGAPKNYQLAKHWYLKAAQAGYAQSENNLGFMYHEGIGGDKNYLEAAKWYKKAANQGNYFSQFNLASLYYYGYGLPRDMKKAFKWTLKSAKQGYPSAEDQNRLYV